MLTNIGFRIPCTINFLTYFTPHYVEFYGNQYSRINLLPLGRNEASASQNIFLYELIQPHQERNNQKCLGMISIGITSEITTTLPTLVIRRLDWPVLIAAARTGAES